MATRADVDEFRQILANLSTLARRDLATIWAPIAGADFADQRRVLDQMWSDLIATYGDLGATVAADMLDEWLADPELVLVEPVDPDRALARMRWAIGTTAAQGNLQVILDELVKQPARSTVAKTAEASGAAWARVPTGGETCSFCLMLASRGAQYRSESSARKAHGFCDCTTIAVQGSADYPAGYDPDDLYEKYAKARADAGSGDLKKILAEMRQREGIN